MMKQAQPRNTYEVTSQEAGTRIDKWFQHHFPTLAGAMVQRIIRKGQVRINGKRISSSTRLAVGDAIRVPPFSNAPKKITSTTAKKIASEIILVKTPDYLIINKPPQMASQGGENVKNHLDSILQALGEGANRPRLVHRLDKATSGIMVVAANAPVAAKLALQFKNRQVGKCYWALVCGVPKSRKGVITQNYNNEQEQTAYQVVASTAVASLIALVPKSGKKHQLRRHCVLLGTPIQGDTRYGQKPLRGIANKLHLHSVYLEFSEPQIYSQSANPATPKTATSNTATSNTATSNTATPKTATPNPATPNTATPKRVGYFAPPPTYFEESVSLLGLNSGSANSSWWKKNIPTAIIKPVT